MTPADVLADHGPHADQLVLQDLLPGEGVLQVLRQSVKIVGRRDVARRPEEAGLRRPGLHLATVRPVQAHFAHDAFLSYLARLQQNRCCSGVRNSSSILCNEMGCVCKLYVSTSQIYLIQYVGAESQNVVGVDPRQFRLLARFAESYVVDETAVAAAGIDEEKFLILK